MSGQRSIGTVSIEVAHCEAQSLYEGLRPMKIVFVRTLVIFYGKS
jgi:hypothetical protein